MTWNSDAEGAGARTFRNSFVARFDGKGFSRLVRSPEFVAPFDNSICQSMHAATDCIIKHLTPDFVYQVSDEISAFFIARPEAGSQLPFGGKESKVCSIGASAAGTAFSLALGKSALFDGRAFDCTADQMPDYLASRLKSGFKNSVSQLAGEHFSAKSLHCRNSAEKLQMLADAGIDYNGMPEDFKYGRIWYKEKQQVWSDVAGEHIQRSRWTSTALYSQLSQAAFSELKRTISELDGRAGPKVDPARS
jgi:tRNA(His) 5'-end guanylyltransferase